MSRRALSERKAKSPRFGHSSVVQYTLLVSCFEFVSRGDVTPSFDDVATEEDDVEVTLLFCDEEATTGVRFAFEDGEDAGTAVAAAGRNAVWNSAETTG